MIYALAKQDTSRDERLSIAQAIRDRNSIVIHQHVTNGTIFHIMDVPNDYESFCIYCCNPVIASDLRAPRGQQAQHTWHFEHTREGHCPGNCVGQVRHPPTPYALNMDLRNPRRHGCYVRLGCETDDNGASSARHRTRCKTIVRGHTYCHLAGQERCLISCEDQHP